MKWTLPTYARIRPVFSDGEPTIQFNNKEVPSDSNINNQERRAPYILEIVPPEYSNRNHLFQSGSLNFPFTKVFDADEGQEGVFETTTRHAVLGALDGYNGTVFAYGQTGSGKTFTMTGGDDFASRGLIPRAITLMFKEIAKRHKVLLKELIGELHSPQEQEKYKVQVTYMQIYNEVLYDLLDVTHQNRSLEEWTKVQVLDDEEGLQHLRNLRVYEVSAEADALNLLFLGQVNRATAATAMNEVSSRSHCIFTLHVTTEGHDATGSKVRRHGKVHLVDLAGSERLFKAPVNGSDTYEYSAATRIEGRHINLSLHFLEQVVLALSAQKKASADAGHVPYRNSMLTTVLKDSLGGNSRTAFIVTLNPESRHLEEAISTCRFAMRCSQLSVNVDINEEQDLESRVQYLTKEAKQLRKKLRRREAQQLTLLARIQELETMLEEKSQLDQRMLTKEELLQCEHVTEAIIDGSGELDAITKSLDRASALECLSILAERCRGASSGHAALLDELAQAQHLQSESTKELETLKEENSQLRAKVEENDELMLQQKRQLQDMKQIQKQLDISQASQQEEKENQKEDRSPPEYYKSMLTAGRFFIKHSSKAFSKPKTRFFWVSDDLQTLYWRKAGIEEANESLPLSSFDAVILGNSNAKTSKGRGTDDSYFTLKKRGGEMLVFQVDIGSNQNPSENMSTRNEWVEAFRHAINIARSKKSLG